MTIKFNNGADPDEVKFNGQDMETVKADGVTVWEKVSGTQYRLTSGGDSSSSTNRGWVLAMFGSINPFPTDFLISFYINTSARDLIIEYSIDGTTVPNRVRFDGVIYPLAGFSPEFGGRKVSTNPASNLLPLFNSIQIIGNHTTFELISP